MPRKANREMVGGCCVCSDERGWDENPLVYCDGAGCNVAVHQGKRVFYYSEKCHQILCITRVETNFLVIKTSMKTSFMKFIMFKHFRELLARSQKWKNPAT